MDRFALDRRALAYAGDIVAQVRPEHLGNPTPCGSWTVAELVAHMTAHNVGFAAAASGHPVGGEIWDLVTAETLPAYAESAALVTAAWESPDLPEKMEVFGFGTVPARTALSMHIVDFTIHGWDVGVSIGVPVAADADLVRDAYAIMREFPVNRPNKAFGLMFPVPDDAPEFDRFLGYVGRDPSWSA
ncbi:MAG: TIGR03086 family protein [Streptomycetaceae bacterium]|nr:TIGR03086 family protein [Streptomycetaceae bacterium]